MSVPAEASAGYFVVKAPTRLNGAGFNMCAADNGGVATIATAMPSNDFPAIPVSDADYEKATKAFIC